MIKRKIYLVVTEKDGVIRFDTESEAWAYIKQDGFKGVKIPFIHSV